MCILPLADQPSRAESASSPAQQEAKNSRQLPEGIDTFITGEGPHWSFTAAEELDMNIFYAGHYATEVFGVKELAKLLEAKFGLPWAFFIILPAYEP